MDKILTQDELKRLLYYNPKTGVFTRRVDTGDRWKVGDVAGCLDRSSGYVRIVVNKKSYRAQRLAHLYMKGYFPEHDMDHKFGIKDDNRWSKIRHATRSCNLQNQKVSKNNRTGFPGVCFDKKSRKWISQIQINKKVVYLGCYTDPLNAALARYTTEVQCPFWTCNHRSELVKAIKKAWPRFNPKV